MEGKAAILKSLARDTMLTILDIDNTPIAIIVLGSEDRKKDTLYLINQVKNIIKNDR
jgi:hypothetical protein